MSWGWQGVGSNDGCAIDEIRVNLPKITFLFAVFLANTLLRFGPYASHELNEVLFKSCLMLDPFDG